MSEFSLFYIPWFPYGFDRDELIELQNFTYDIMDACYNGIGFKPPAEFMISPNHIGSNCVLYIQVWTSQTIKFCPSRK